MVQGEVLAEVDTGVFWPVDSRGSPIGAVRALDLLTPVFDWVSFFITSSPCVELPENGEANIVPLEDARGRYARQNPHRPENRPETNAALPKKLKRGGRREPIKITL